MLPRQAGHRRAVVSNAPTVSHAAPRDASFYGNPSTNQPWRIRYHIVSEDGHTSCCRPDLLPLDTVGGLCDAAEVADRLRCRRPGCRERWP